MDGPISTPSEAPPERSGRDAKNAFTFITSLVLLGTSLLVLVGLTYVAISASILWIKGLLVLLGLLWILMIAQSVRLALVCAIGISQRPGILPNDYLLAADTLPVNSLSDRSFQASTIPENQLYVTQAPELLSLSVLIPVVNEDEDLIRRGIHSVKAARYSGLLKIYLLDDSPDGRYKSLAKEEGIEYIARPVKTHGKAGNLNYALKNFVNTELFFVMDCDYQIVDPDIFTKMVSVMDEKTALVQAPQRYVNVGDSHASEFAEIENIVWFDTINMHADRYDIVPYHGTNSIVRMDALREVGYLDEDAAVDDFPTYARMLMRGWKTSYIPDVVMEGSAPKDLAALMKQRKKWAMGMGKAFVSVGHKLIGKGFVQSIHHWCNFTWFSWPVTLLAYSVVLSVFVVLEYLHVFKIPMIHILVLLNLVTSIGLFILLGGRKYWRRFYKMLSMDYLLTYEFGYNYIRGMLGARTDILTPKRNDAIATLQVFRLAVPMILTSIFFMGITVIALLIPHPFYASFFAYNAFMYLYALGNLSHKERTAEADEQFLGCPRCSAVVSVNDNYCDYCGTSLHRHPATRQRPPRLSFKLFGASPWGSPASFNNGPEEAG